MVNVNIVFSISFGSHQFWWCGLGEVKDLSIQRLIPLVSFPSSGYSQMGEFPAYMDLLHEMHLIYGFQCCVWICYITVFSRCFLAGYLISLN